MVKNYEKLDSDYQALRDLYSKRIEQSQEIAEHISRDVFDINYTFRNTAIAQIDS
jgi:hypothetical protein